MPPKVPPEIGTIIPPPADRTNRTYTSAVWKPAGGGSGDPKISGGVETSNSSGRPCGRGFNRPDQRYTQPPATLTTNRIARATTEYATSLVLQLNADQYQVITNNGNAYSVSRSLDACSCPDFFRLNESYPGAGLLCKHIYMAQHAVSDFGAAGVPVSVGYITTFSTLADRTVMEKMATGEIPARIVINAWSATVADVAAWWAIYRLKLIPPGDPWP